MLKTLLEPRSTLFIYSSPEGRFTDFRERGKERKNIDVREKHRLVSAPLLRLDLGIERITFRCVGQHSNHAETPGQG